MAISSSPEYSLSEYTLYGIFVREFLGYDTTNHAPSHVPLIKSLMGNELINGYSLDNFFSDFDPKTIEIMVHSKGGIEPHEFRKQLESLWRTSL